MEEQRTRNKAPEGEEGIESSREAEPVEEASVGDAVPEEGDQMNLDDMMEASLKSVQPGEVVQGRVVKITKEHVMVDVGYKSEGRINIDEFQDHRGNIKVKEGDVIDVLVESWENEEGEVVLSKDKAAKIKVWDDIRDAHNNGRPVKGKILSRVKGGFTVDVGVQAFLPASQVDLRPMKDQDSLLGQTLEFRILKFNKKRGNVVVSRRILMEEQRESLRHATLEKLKESDVLEGVVKNITDYGAFVDLGGIDGLLHITDMSWGRIKHASELLKVGETVTVKVLHYDPKTERVSLGMKQLLVDPWQEAAGKYPAGTKVNGKVVSLTDYGAFVELEPGVEGLIHLSEMSWTKKVRHPSQVLSVGDEVDAVVLEMKPEAKRVSLGLKQVSRNPWEAIGDKYPEGTVIEGRIKNITDFGVFIGIDEGIDGLVHISDLSWSQRVKHPSDLFKKGQEVQAKVLKIDKENERFSLSIKHVVPDPWESVPKKYPVGSRIHGTVTNATDFGVFVELEEGVEGLIHISEISNEKIATPIGMFQPGGAVDAQVIAINKKDRKIGLSIKRMEEDADKVLVKEYLHSGQAPFSSLGEILRENLENKAREMEQEASSRETRGTEKKSD